MKVFISIVFTWLLLFSGAERDSNASYSRLDYHANDAAKQHFNQGLLLLHNFEYVDAAEEFLLAQKADPDFALAYWGEAMTYDHPIWRDLNIEHARNAVNKLGKSREERVAKGQSLLEKDLIVGVDILFGEGTKKLREKAYSEHMQQLYDKYPGNDDIATFYALSLLALKKGWNEWEEQNVKAGEIVSKVLERSPEHSGALHYLVHADDHPLYAKNGLAAADKYGKVASYAGHALHMPSHIYLALGMWDEVIKANEVSWKAGVDRQRKKNLNNDQLNYHANLWLAYACLQQGKFERARKIIDAQVKFTNELSSVRSRFHLMEMKGHYLFTTGDWYSPIANITYKTDDLDHGSQYTERFLEGYKLFQQKNTSGLTRHLELYEKELTKAKGLQLVSQDVAVCGVTRYTNATPTETEITNAERLLLELKALQAWLSKDYNSADSFFKQSLPKDGTVVVGPPVFLISPHELYGNYLLERKQPREAIIQFDKAIAASPNRLLSLKGKLIAARMMNNSSIESEVKEQLKLNMKDADPGITRDLW